MSRREQGEDSLSGFRRHLAQDPDTRRRFLDDLEFYAILGELGFNTDNYPGLVAYYREQFPEGQPQEMIDWVKGLTKQELEGWKSS